MEAIRPAGATFAARAAPGKMPADRQRLLRVLLLAIVAAGIGVRIRQFAARTSFWADEGSLILNLRLKTDRELMGKLEHEQAAPPVFLWIQKAAYRQFGANEYALRALPLAAGVGALLIFAMLAWRMFVPAAALFAIAWFSFCDKAIEYSSELKQYSSDLLIAVTLLFIALGWRPRRDTPARRFAVLAIVSMGAVWFSHSAAIMFGALSLTLAAQCLKGRSHSKTVWLAGNAAVCLSFGALYALSIHRQHQPYLYEFWGEGFPNLSVPLRLPLWLARQGYEFCNTPQRRVGFLVMPLALAGACWLARQRRWNLLSACAVPIGLTILAALLHQYPFNGSRLTLFLFPGLFMLCAAGVEAGLSMLPARARLWWWALALPIVIAAAAEAVQHVVRPRYLSGIRPVAAFVRAQRQAGEALYILGEPRPPGEALLVSGRHVEFFAYWPDPPPPVYEDLKSVDDIKDKRFWIVLSFSPEKVRNVDRLFKAIQDVAFMQRCIVDSHGAAAALFGLKHAPAAQPSPGSF